VIFNLLSVFLHSASLLSSAQKKNSVKNHLSIKYLPSVKRSLLSVWDIRQRMSAR
jgi:hypothetical protein